MRRMVYISVCLALCLLATGCTRTRITGFRAEVAESPEVEGVRGYLEPHSSTFRFSGSYLFSPKETMAVSGSYSDYSADSLMRPTREFTAKGVYELGGSDLNASFEWFKKLHFFLWGLGIGYDDGVYHHLKIGFNTRFVEAGAFMGTFHQYTTMTVHGEQCDVYPCSDSDNWKSIGGTDTDFYASLFMGLYATIMIDDFFLSYSLSSYSPAVEADGEDLSAPSIDTHYIMAGYRFNTHWEVSGGVAMTLVNPDYRHFAAKFGVGYVFK